MWENNHHHIQHVHRKMIQFSFTNPDRNKCTHYHDKGYAGLPKHPNPHIITQFTDSRPILQNVSTSKTVLMQIPIQSSFICMYSDYCFLADLITHQSTVQLRMISSGHVISKHT